MITINVPLPSHIREMLNSSEMIRLREITGRNILLKAKVQFDTSQNSKSPAWTAVISNFLYLIHEKLKNMSVSKESQATVKASAMARSDHQIKKHHTALLQNNSTLQGGKFEQTSWKILKKKMPKQNEIVPINQIRKRTA